MRVFILRSCALLVVFEVCVLCLYSFVFAVCIIHLVLFLLFVFGYASLYPARLCVVGCVQSVCVCCVCIVLFFVVCCGSASFYPARLRRKISFG